MGFIYSLLNFHLLFIVINFTGAGNKRRLFILNGLVRHFFQQLRQYLSHNGRRGNETFEVISVYRKFMERQTGLFGVYLFRERKRFFKHGYALGGFRNLRGIVRYLGLDNVAEQAIAAT